MELSKTNILVTGGAGFIGSNLVATLLDDPRVGLVRVLDNLSNGYSKTLNLSYPSAHPFSLKGPTAQVRLACLRIFGKALLVSTDIKYFALKKIEFTNNEIQNTV